MLPEDSHFGWTNFWGAAHIRKGKTVTHETLGNLSHLPEHVIEIIKRSLKGETFVPAAEAFRITCARSRTAMSRPS